MSERNEWKQWVKAMSVKKKEVVGDACRLDRWRLGAAFPSPPFQPSPGLQMSPLPVFHSFRISWKNSQCFTRWKLMYPHPVFQTLDGVASKLSEKSGSRILLTKLFVPQFVTWMLRLLKFQGPTSPASPEPIASVLLHGHVVRPCNTAIVSFCPSFFYEWSCKWLLVVR